MWTPAVHARLARDDIAYATSLTQPVARATGWTPNGLWWPRSCPPRPGRSSSGCGRCAGTASPSLPSGGSPAAMVVERTFAHTRRCRRLARDLKATGDAALGFFVLANAMLLVRRLAQEL